MKNIAKSFYSLKNRASKYTTEKSLQIQGETDRSTKLGEPFSQFLKLIDNKVCKNGGFEYTTDQLNLIYIKNKFPNRA